ncbi:hypothetical protein Q8W71_20830 [Methylobacterium sp. NEAU 140]|uniref:hypothetical protein n=1 Tax=Methylobacterium sp. NEAU 140 TaxID=3064945 RepID=UPI002732588F|nr:hypothetical protein [Methylobacterium sp. NEAU 140]MDP4025078.1 hypothetical protein [Methylobacterium sp. NEAU 140]
MRILRPLLGGLAVLLSTTVVVLVSADRLALTPPPVAVARAAVPEPSATGSIPAPVKAAPAPKPAAPSIPSGFDTERLHALMRGDPILPGR